MMGGLSPMTVSPLFSLSSPTKHMLIFFVFGILLSVLIFFISSFFSWTFYKSFVLSPFSHSIVVCYIVFFPIRILFFGFLIFFFGFFVKVLLVFNFIIQSKFMVYYFFQLDSYSFDFIFFLLKSIFFLI
jgi:hypothetical protein